MPLRDRVREAERLTRELTDHLERGFLPKVQEARRSTKPTPANLETVMDSTVRSTTEAALSSHEYTMQLARNLDMLLGSIDRELQWMISGGDGNPESKKRSN